MQDFSDQGTDEQEPFGRGFDQEEFNRTHRKRKKTPIEECMEIVAKVEERMKNGELKGEILTNMGLTNNQYINMRNRVNKARVEEEERKGGEGGHISDDEKNIAHARPPLDDLSDEDEEAAVSAEARAAMARKEAEEGRPDRRVVLVLSPDAQRFIEATARYYRVPEEAAVQIVFMHGMEHLNDLAEEGRKRRKRAEEEL